MVFYEYEEIPYVLVGVAIILFIVIITLIVNGRRQSK